ncbi:MAG: hypothetical protein JRE16_02475 [Deltaproteobacteria bacterium]|nr:hypothetical protein [Deltaproteobacteria bacterium]MBW2478041.1 hypothetical protein [Deltaproteobacteria bacterium]MBW2503413.1 hypothetical protein [Deltaproteobacteria bacterium]
MPPLTNYTVDTARYAQCIEVSKRIHWDIDRDVIQGREFDFSQKFLPDGLSRVDRLDFLNSKEKRFLSQIQGRTYANMFGFVERFITAKILELTRDHWLGDQVALEALVRFCDEELKHQTLFVRIEKMMSGGMPPGYHFLPVANEIASAVLERSSWAVLALIYEIELFTQEHYKQSIKPDDELSALYKDVFLFHAKEESQHAIMDSLEWSREAQKLDPAQCDGAISDLIELVGAIDGILQKQAVSDVRYFLEICERTFSADEIRQIEVVVLQAYRWQYIFSGVEDQRFKSLLGNMVTESQGQRISEALMPLR